METLKTVSDELRTIIAQFSSKLNAISEREFDVKPSPTKWSKKEIIGHLTDSAQNNLRRFITTQYEAIPPHIVYDQDFWVASNDYTSMSQVDIVQLWRLINERICVILARMPESSYQKECNTGKGGTSLRTLEWLGSDYVAHLKHHLNQVIPDAFPGHDYASR